MDLPSGPLDVYRQKASFSWKEMLDFLEGEDIQAFKVPRPVFSRCRGSSAWALTVPCAAATHIPNPGE